MKQTPEILFAVTGLSANQYLIKPRYHRVLGRDGTVFRIPLATTIEDAIMFTYPELQHRDFKQIKLQVWMFNPGKRHHLVSPGFLQKFYNLPHATTLGEMASFKNIRMQKAALVRISKNNPLNEPISIEQEGSESLLFTRYAVLPAV